MPFPTNPAPGQEHTENNTTYVYGGLQNGWWRKTVNANNEINYGSSSGGGGGDASASNQLLGNTSLANLDTNLGARADASAGTDTGTFSLISLFKRSVSNLSTLVVSVGGTSDAAASADTGTFSLNALVKRLLGKFPAIVKTPTTTSVASSATSVTILATNANRKGFSVSNVSTSKLYLSYTTPATVANCFVELPANSFIMLDQQCIATNNIYGIWLAANGTAQVTEYV